MQCLLVLIHCLIPPCYMYSLHMLCNRHSGKEQYSRLHLKRVFLSDSEEHISQRAMKFLASHGSFLSVPAVLNFGVGRTTTDKICSSTFDGLEKRGTSHSVSNCADYIFFVNKRGGYNSSIDHSKECGEKPCTFGLPCTWKIAIYFAAPLPLLWFCCNTQ